MDTQKSKNEVLEYLTTIPPGKVTTYKFLAQKFKMHPRQIGKILSQNTQTSKYPCYKVVRSDGTLGGYILGENKKIKKLKDEGIEIKNGKIDLSKYGWFK